MGAILLACVLVSLTYTCIWPGYYKVHFAGVVFNFMLTSLALIGGRLACIGGRNWLDHFHAGGVSFLHHHFRTKEGWPLPESWTPAC